MMNKLSGQLPTQFDEIGVQGSILHYAMVIFFVLAALLIFIHLWWMGRLDMDEEPKMQMMQDREENHDI